MLVYALLLFQLSFRSLQGGWETLINFKCVKHSCCDEERNITVAVADEVASSLPNDELPSPQHALPASVADKEHRDIALV